ncbi:MAG: divalent-cation tolerance protein CutA [bacterium]|nr:divalent-cation tolerance protein CutA [bacterium]
MKRLSHIVIFITASTDEEAKKIANALLNKKKAACVNILPGVHSLFWWQGGIDSASEVLLIVKTEEHLLDDVVKLVKELHGYSVPEIIALPIIGGNQEYLKWVSESIGNKE